MVLSDFPVGRCVSRNANQPDRDRFEFQRPLGRVEEVPCSEM